jgi:4-hydroxy 2-oxovalerate aldolase
MGHRFSAQHVAQIASALDAAGVDVIEVTHGDGLGGSSMQYGFSSTPELELIECAAAHVKRARIAALLIPGVGTRRDVAVGIERGAQVIRIATQCTEADISEQHFGMVKEQGLEAVGFLMMSHMLPPAELAEQAARMESYGADCVYIVDSAGALIPDGVRRRVSALKTALSIDVGFHAHNNMGLAMGNTVAAVETGVEQVDGCLRGLGAGAGNAATELLAPVFDRMGLESSLNGFALADAAEALAPIAPRISFPDRDSIALGYAGVYSTFLLHAKRRGEQFGVDPREILMELGRRGAVAGQEDWILDVAQELANA